MRDKLFTIRMSDEERARAERVAEAFGLNMAGVFRMLIKREDDLLKTKPKAASKKRAK